MKIETNNLYKADDVQVYLAKKGDSNLKKNKLT